MRERVRRESDGEGVRQVSFYISQKSHYLGECQV